MIMNRVSSCQPWTKIDIFLKYKSYWSFTLSTREVNCCHAGSKVCYAIREGLLHFSKPSLRTGSSKLPEIRRRPKKNFRKPVRRLFKTTRPLRSSLRSRRRAFFRCRQSCKRTSQFSLTRWKGHICQLRSVYFYPFCLFLFFFFFLIFVGCRHNCDWRRRETYVLTVVLSRSRAITRISIRL